jgi:internalin A
MVPVTSPRAETPSIEWQLTDAGPVHLNGLTNLSHLDLSYTKVSDYGLVHLRPLKKLSRLDVFGNRVTDAGLKQLRLPAPRPTLYY